MLTEYNVVFNENKKPSLEVVRLFDCEDKAFTLPEDIIDFVTNELRLNIMTEEYVYMMAFNTELYCKGIFQISHGSICESVADIKSIFTRILLSGAWQFVVIHNHPSGYANPSKSDDKVTDKIKKASKIMDFRFLDHIIIGEHDYYSYSSHKLM